MIGHKALGGGENAKDFTVEMALSMTQLPGNPVHTEE